MPLHLLNPMRGVIVVEYYFKVFGDGMEKKCCPLTMRIVAQSAGEVLFVGLGLAWLVTYVINPDVIERNPLKVRPI
jgi:hypothetical protein